MPKVIIGVVLFFGLVYLFYSLNDLSGQLKNTERTAERYRREQESLSAQLQGRLQTRYKCGVEKGVHYLFYIYFTNPQAF